MRQIGDVLRANAQLESLALSKCHIPTCGAKALAHELSSHAGLRGLDFGHNPFGTEGMELIISPQSLQVGEALVP